MTRLNRVILGCLLAAGMSGLAANAAPITGYTQTNLVSDLSGITAVQDPNLQNPWGVSESSTSPLWVSDQVANIATLYMIQGVAAARFPSPTPLVVPIPPTLSGPQGPTGQVNNSIGGVATTSFNITQSGGPMPVPAHFIFADLSGNIYAWTAAPNPAQIQVTTPGAIYTGLAIGGTTSAPFLYAANNAQNSIDVFNGSFTNVTSTTFAGKFANPFKAQGLVPFNVQNLGGNIYVTYAPPGRPAEIAATGGQGGVAIFTPDGTLVRSFTDGHLASPWGLALAPSSFGQFGGDLLVGNFAYGNINGVVNPVGALIDAYDANGDFLGTLDSNSAWQGLWALTFGNGGSGGDANILYFTTGLNSETDGLLAAVAAVPEPSTLALLSVGVLGIFGLRRRGVARRRGALGGPI